MKATELINRLQQVVAREGDLNVTVFEEGKGFLDANKIQIRIISNDEAYLAIIYDDK